MNPDLAASVLLDLDESHDLRQQFRDQGYLSVAQIAAHCLDHKPTSIEARGIIGLLKRVGWRQLGRRFVPPPDHPIRMAKPMPEVTDRVRLLVGRSDLPEEYHAEVMHEIVHGAREWSINDNRIHYVIAKTRKKLKPPAENPEDVQLREDIMLWLEDPETKALVESRPHKHVTPWEVIEGIMRIPDAKMFRDLSRVMPWPKHDVRIGDRVIKAYVRPTNEMSIRTAPNLDGLPAYLADRYVAVETEILRDVSKLPVRQSTASDRAHLRTAMRSLGWTRQRSLHGAGWIYLKS